MHETRTAILVDGGFYRKRAAWIEIHRDELQADWKLLSEGKEYFKIEPLK